MATLQLGTQLGKHVIGRLLGAGRSAAVYETTAADGSVRALKVLEADVRLGVEDRQRFREEWGAVAGLAHDNVVGHLEAGVDGGRAWVLTELVRGSSLRRLVRAEGGRIPVDRAVDIVRQAAEGIAAAHEKGIVHGEIRPENILVGPGDRVKVSDFGSAIGGEAPEAEEDVAVCLYAAPEWLLSRIPELSNDVYVLGLVLYEACAGFHPGLGPLGTPIETGRRQILEAPPPLSSWSTPERVLPDDLSELCASALAKDPDVRCSMRALAEGLARVLARLRPPAVPIAPVAPIALVGPVAPIPSIPPTLRGVPEVAMPREDRSSARRARWPALTAAAAVLALGSGATGWLLGASLAQTARAPPAITADRASITATAPPPVRTTAPRPRAPPRAPARAPPPRPRPPFH